MAIRFGKTLSQHAPLQKERTAPMKINPPIREKSAFFNFLIRFSIIPAKEKIFFVQQMGVMIKTGISLAAGLKTLIEQTHNRRFKKILVDLKQTVERGNLLSDGLQKYEDVFGELFVNMVRAGEASGKLEEVFEQLFIQMKRDHTLLSCVRGAMIYPSVILIAMAGVGIMVMVYVIPNLISIFEEAQAHLPLATIILINISHFITHYGLFILIGLVIFIMIFLRALAYPKIRYLFHGILLKMPLMGKILKKINLARFCRTFSSLLKTDISIIRTFEITANVLGNTHYRKALLEAKEKIKKGLNIHDALAPYPHLFPPIILQMLSVGEETGSLDSILVQSALFYEEEVDQTMKNLPSLIEPIFILILGIGVAFMAIAVIMPLYSLGEQI